MLPKTLQSTAAILLLTPASSWLSISPSFVAERRQRSLVVARSTTEPPAVLDAEILRDDDDDETSPADSSLLDISLNNFADPELRNTRIPFLDMISQRSIDVRLALMATVDGVDYGIAVPFDAAAAILVEGPPSPDDINSSKLSSRAVDSRGTNRTLQFISPDDDADEELMNIMANQLREQVSPDLKMLRTPRVLTISGPIDGVTARWKKELLPEPISVKKLIEPLEEEGQDDGGEAYFLDFMKKNLGEDTFNKVLATDPDPELMSDQILEFFDMPSKAQMEEDLHEPEKMAKVIDDTIGNVDRDVVGLRLVAYFLANGRSYSLVQLLKPVTLVAKFVEGRFEFLKSEEQDIVIPKLEQLYRVDLESAGLELQP